MNKKLLIALADSIRNHNDLVNRLGVKSAFNTDHIERLADFCAEQNPNFKWQRWLDYIAGKCGPNGGAIKR